VIDFLGKNLAILPLRISFLADPMVTSRRFPQVWGQTPRGLLSTILRLDSTLCREENNYANIIDLVVTIYLILFKEELLHS